MSGLKTITVALIFGAWILSLSSNSAAQIHQCDGPEGPIFSDRRCELPSVREMLPIDLFPSSRLPTRQELDAFTIQMQQFYCISNATSAKSILRGRYNGRRFEDYAEADVGSSFRYVIMAFDRADDVDEGAQADELERLERLAYSTCMRESMEFPDATLLNELHRTCNNVSLETRRLVDLRHQGLTRGTLAASLRHNAVTWIDPKTSKLVLDLGLTSIDQVYGLPKAESAEARMQQKNSVSREVYKKCESILKKHLREELGKSLR